MKAMENRKGIIKLIATESYRTHTNSKHQVSRHIFYPLSAVQMHSLFLRPPPAILSMKHNFWKKLPILNIKRASCKLSYEEKASTRLVKSRLKEFRRGQIRFGRAELSFIGNGAALKRQDINCSFFKYYLCFAAQFRSFPFSNESQFQIFGSSNTSPATSLSLISWFIFS